MLRSYGLSCVGGVRPGRVAHDAGHDPLPTSPARWRPCWRAGADVLVLAAATGDPTATTPARTLDEAQWATLLANLDRLGAAAADRGMLAVLHPHVGTMVENRAEVRPRAGGSAIQLCLDTGHLLIGGTDPLQLAREVPGRIAHTHLKDVDATLAARVQAGEMTYTEAVRAGMYTPLGTGDVDIAGIVKALRANGFDGWFVMEQDTILDGEPAGEGPLGDVRASVDYLQRHRPLGDGMRIGSARRIPHRRVGDRRPRQELGHRLVAVAARDPERARRLRRKVRCRAGARFLPGRGHRSRGRRRLQPAGQLAARSLEPGGGRGGQAGTD